MTNTMYPVGTVLYFYHEKLNQIVQITVIDHARAEITEKVWNQDKYGYSIAISEAENKHLADNPSQCLKNVWNEGVKAFTDKHARLVAKAVEIYPQIAMVQ